MFTKLKKYVLKNVFLINREKTLIIFNSILFFLHVGTNLTVRAKVISFIRTLLNDLNEEVEKQIISKGGFYETYDILFISSTRDFFYFCIIRFRLIQRLI